MRSRSIVFTTKAKYAKRVKRKPKKVMPCYEARSGRLSELGYASYKEYLASEDWKAIRARKLAAEPKCLLCRRASSQVHHLSYADNVLLGLEPRLLVTMCDVCHEWIEFDGTRKRDLKEANDTLKAKAKALGLRSWLDSVGWATPKDVPQRPSHPGRRKR